MRIHKTLFLVLVTIFLVGCVSTHNSCGNEQRDWDNLTFPKGNYCSLPKYLPLKSVYESANRAICKVHDNNRGIAGTISRAEADRRFLCDYIKRSKLPWGVRHVTGYLSYFFVRLKPTKTRDSDGQSSSTPAADTRTPNN